MNSFAAFVVLTAALAFCGVANRLMPTDPSAPPAGSPPAVSSAADAVAAGSIKPEKSELTSTQTAILEKGKNIAWSAQGLEWRVPANWRKISEERNLFNWGSPDNAFLIATISPLDADFPVEQSIKAFYDGAVTRQKNGEVETLRYLELDGVKGVEFTETSIGGRDSPQRRQWIAYRKHAGQTQLLNLMATTKAGNFDKHRDEFAAILYSTKIAQE